MGRHLSSIQMLQHLILWSPLLDICQKMFKSYIKHGYALHSVGMGKAPLPLSSRGSWTSTIRLFIIAKSHGLYASSPTSSDGKTNFRQAWHEFALPGAPIMIHVVTPPPSNLDQESAAHVLIIQNPLDQFSSSLITGFDSTANYPGRPVSPFRLP